MPDDPELESPNTRLAKQIVQKLYEEGLIPENRLSDLEAKLTGSGVSQDDWNLWLDISTALTDDNGNADVNTNHTS